MILVPLGAFLEMPQSFPKPGSTPLHEFIRQPTFRAQLLETLDRRRDGMSARQPFLYAVGLKLALAQIGKAEHPDYRG